MVRYFLDTGVVIGFTFLHDLWRTEADRVFDSGNPLIIDDGVLFEYCNYTSNNSFESADLDWESEDGRWTDCDVCWSDTISFGN